MEGPTREYRHSLIREIIKSSRFEAEFLGLVRAAQNHIIEESGELGLLSTSKDYVRSHGEQLFLTMQGNLLLEGLIENARSNKRGNKTEHQQTIQNLFDTKEEYTDESEKRTLRRQAGGILLSPVPHLIVEEDSDNEKKKETLSWGHLNEALKDKDPVFLPTEKEFLFSIGFEFEDLTWAMSYKDGLTTIDGKDYKGFDLKGIMPILTCKNSEGKDLWDLTVDTDSIEIVTRPIYIRRQSKQLEKYFVQEVQEIIASIDKFVTKYRTDKEKRLLIVAGQEQSFSSYASYALYANYTGVVSFIKKAQYSAKHPGNDHGLLYPQFTVNLPIEKVKDFCTKYRQKAQVEQSQIQLHNPLLTPFDINADTFSSKREGINWVIEYLVKTLYRKHTETKNEAKYLFLLMPRTSISAFLDEQGRKEYPALIDAIINEIKEDQDKPAYLIADSNYKEHGEKLNKREWGEMLKDLFFHNNAKKHATYSKAPNTGTLHCTNYPDKYRSRYQYRDMLSPPPWIEYESISSDAVCAWAPIDGFFALEARNNNTASIGVNKINKWNKLNEIYSIIKWIKASLYSEPPSFSK